MNILVFLSVFATLNSSHAGNSGSGGENQEEAFNANILVPFKGRPKANIQALYDLSDESTVSSHFLPLELWEQIFAMLDYDGTVSAAQVRKHWRWIILEKKGHLKYFFSHPMHIVSMQ